MQKIFQNIWGLSAEETLSYQGSFVNDAWNDGVLKGNNKCYQVSNGIPLFGSDAMGDQFDHTDISSWTNGFFKKIWKDQSRLSGEIADECRLVCQRIVELNRPVIDIASGPGLGFLPDIVKMNPSLPCLATDASSLVMLEWQKFLAQSTIRHQVSLASFSLDDIPILSESVDIVTSYIGLSSVRSIGQAKTNSVSEVARILKKNGYLFGVEAQWKDFGAVKEVFRLWNQPCWFDDNEPTWEEKFQENRLQIVRSQPLKIHKLTPDDNGLGEASQRFGIDLFLQHSLYELKKE